jgi:hypothetical protein
MGARKVCCQCAWLRWDAACLLNPAPCARPLSLTASRVCVAALLQVENFTGARVDLLRAVLKKHAA